MNYIEAMEYIQSFTRSGRRITDLSRIRGLLSRLGDPHKGQNFVHIAGTNGKGSVLEMLANTFINAGCKVGQFTSPYVETYCDRIRINGRNISRNSVGKLCSRVSAAVDNDYYSQFEITFALALLYFKSERCDIVFLETGIGGDLDATNVVEEPLVSVITSVSLDHVAVLGNTVEEIAAHKLGIIKNGCPAVVSCDNKDTVLEMAAETALRRESVLTVPDRKKCTVKSSDINGSVFDYNGAEYRLAMCGEHQIVNALTVIETVSVLRDRYNISGSDLEKAFAETRVPLRAEIISRDPLIIIDGGHNAAGIDSFAEVLEMSGIERAVGLFGMVYGKSVNYAVERMSRYFIKVYCADGYIDNNMSAENLMEKFRQSGVEAEGCHYSIGCRMALEYAKRHKLPLIVNGSLYLTSAVKKELKKKI